MSKVHVRVKDEKGKERIPCNVDHWYSLDTYTPKGFMEIPKNHRCQRCEKHLRKLNNNQPNL